MLFLIINVVYVFIIVNSSFRGVLVIFWVLFYRKCCFVCFVKEGIRNKEVKEKISQFLFVLEEGVWDGEVYVVKCGGGVLWYDKSF